MKWSIGKIASKRALFTPDNIAIIYEDTPVTYKEFNEETNRVANFLRSKGIKKGDRIAVVLYNCVEFLNIYMAAAKLGIIFVPLNFRLVAPELKYQINRCGCRLVVFHDDFIKNIDPIKEETTIEKDKFICIRLNLHESLPEWAIDYEQAIKGHSTREPEDEALIDLDDALMVLYTSGVAGDPKGAVLSHGQTYFKNFQIILYTNMREEDRVIFQSPLCHSAGLCAVATPTLCRGATLVMRRKFDAHEFAKDIERYKATIVFGLTTMFRFMLRSGALDNVDLSSVRVAFGGGERTPSSLLAELAKKGLHLQMGFGQTENSAMALMPRHAIEKKKGSCGLPNFFTDIWIVNEKGEKLPPGEVGEIVAIGPNVMSGYWDMPEETEKAIVDGILHTGDLGYMDEDGYLYIVDRLKDMYRSGAENVYPAEVERILIEHPKIENVAIIGVPDEKWGETGKAFIQVKKGEKLTKEEILEFLEGKIAHYKFPTKFEFVDSLPLTAWGKIKKIALKEKEMERYRTGD